ncbi:MAG: outer membrane lipoprotein-sorting protein [Bdellovibrionota bacterium]
MRNTYLDLKIFSKIKILCKISTLSIIILLSSSNHNLYAKDNKSNDTEAEKKGYEIAKKMLDRKSSSSSYNKVILISCDYSEDKTGKRSCRAGKRVKTFESLGQDQENGNVKKNLSVIIEPAQDQGVSFLQVDYEKSQKTSDQWIYLPALKKMKRIVSESGSGPKSGTFFGSELAYEDMEKKHLEDFNSKLIGEDKVDGANVWVIEMSPIGQKKSETSYAKSKLWVDKKKDIALKAEVFDKQNRLAKTFYTKDIKLDKGIWVSHQQIIVNHKNNRMSLMKTMESKINIQFSEQLLSQRSLKDQDFRNKEMKKIR